jgi:hypothetical protein
LIKQVRKAQLMIASSRWKIIEICPLKNGLSMRYNGLKAMEDGEVMHHMVPHKMPVISLGAMVTIEVVEDLIIQALILICLDLVGCKISTKS